MYKLITHNDLDGISCELLFRAQDIIHIDEFISCNYGNVASEVSNTCAGDILYITDLSCDKDTLLNTLDKGVIVVILDHHRSALWLNDIRHPNLTVILDMDKSGTLITFEYLVNAGCAISMYKDYVDAVNSHDLWLRNNDHSSKLASLYSLLGRDAYLDRFLSNPNLVYTNTEQLILSIEKGKMDHAIERALNIVVRRVDTNGNTYGILYNDSGFTSEVGNAVASIDGIDYAIIVHMHIRPTPTSTLGVVSLRSTGKVDVGEIAEKHKGGGHRNAAGFLLENWDPVFFGVDIRVNL